MSASTPAQILVLRKEPSGERFWQCAVISPELGGCICMLRRQRPGKRLVSSVEPDLFDTATVRARKPSGSEILYFADDYEPMVRRGGLGKGYPTLRAASFWTGFLSRNLAAVPVDAEALVFDHAARALDYLEQGLPPEFVLLKAFYLLLKLEGYPVKESWWRGLSVARQRLVTDYLRTEMNADAVRVDADLQSVFQDLCDWTQRNTELRLPTY